MSENQQNDRQEDVLPDEPVGADGAESAEPVNGSCPERPADAPTQESVPEVTNPSSEASQTPEANTRNSGHMTTRTPRRLMHKNQTANAAFGCMP